MMLDYLQSTHWPSLFLIVLFITTVWRIKEIKRDQRKILRRLQALQED